VTRVVALIPAHNEADRIAETIRALKESGAATEIVVIDDGSTDATAETAKSVGADEVLSLPENCGKGAAVNAGLLNRESDIFLLLDADLGESAREASKLLEPLQAGLADMSIAMLPEARLSNGRKSGGFGLVLGLARLGIRLLAKERVQAPLSGQRAIRAEVLREIAPLDSGFGLEVAMTIDALKKGCRIVETPVDFHHRPTGRNLSGFLHRGRQFVDVARALIGRI
jgi:glycosyltransferase involved in cell wall biosynthesis